jgi:hypothetical protein
MKKNSKEKALVVGGIFKKPLGAYDFKQCPLHYQNE